MTRSIIEEVLMAVGLLLQSEGEEAAIVIVGGASLSLSGYVPRVTEDVDVIARLAEEEGIGGVRLIHPDPLPASLQRAILKVARDFGLDDRWMNTEVALQWHSGLPPGMPDEIEWRRFGALNVGLVGRRTLIALKLFAAVDDGPRGVHFQDLVALKPTREELSEAGEWVGTQDVSEPFHVMLGQVLQQLNNR